MMQQARKSNLVDITVRILHTSERAVLADHGGEEPVWLPLSQIEIAPSGEGCHEITLPEWLAIEKGMV